MKTVLCVVRVAQTKDNENIETIFHSRIYGLGFIISKLVTKLPGSEGELSKRFHLLLGNSRGMSSTFILDISKRSVVLFDKILKSYSKLS